MVSGAVAIETRLQGGQPIEGAASGLVGLRAHEDHAAVAFLDGLGLKHGVQLRLGDRLAPDLIEEGERQRRVVRERGGLGGTEGDLVCGKR